MSSRLKQLKALALRPVAAVWLAAGITAGLVGGLVGGAVLAQGTAAGVPKGDAGRAAIEKIVREYILANPEIIPEAMTRLQSREASRMLASNRTEIETPFAGASAGNPKGNVALVVFFDFACPYCKQGSADVARLLAEDKNLRVVYRDFPVLSPASEEAAMASLSAAQQGRYLRFHDAMFAGQGRVSRERTVATVRQAGLDESRTARDLTATSLKAEIKKNLDLGRALGLSGTPSYIVGDRVLSGAVGYDALKAAVAEARTETRSAG
jgi:protein-disulfide isomerase